MKPSASASAIQIRPASRRDIRAWAAMSYALWPQAPLASHAQEIAAMLKRPRFRAWIAELDGKPVAFAEAYIREFANGCEGQPVAFLEGIWVDKKHRRRGIGKKLIAAVAAWAKKRGLKELGSDAYADDKLSHKSHTGWGFKQTERVVYFRKKISKGKP